MKTKLKNHILQFATVIVFGASTLCAQVNLPPFATVTNTLAIPTNSVGFEVDTNAVVQGMNVVYTFKGQFFTNSAQGQIPITAQNIVGTTDKSTPWKTLAELLSAYSNGATSNNIASLYVSESQAFINSIFTNSTAAARFAEFAGSITNLSVLAGAETTGSDYAVVAAIQTTDSADPEPLPFFLKKTQGSGTNFVYLLSARPPSSPMEANLISYINSTTVTNIHQQ